MANNCYMACKQMRAIGMDAIYILDHFDNYAMSQPIWEDQRFSLPYQTVVESSGWDMANWRRQADLRNWRKPDWIIDPLGLTEEAEPEFLPEWQIDLSNYTPAPGDHYRRIIEVFRGCDLLFVSNVHAIILALLSARPFVICPAGGEFLLATDRVSADGPVGETYRQQGVLLRAAFARCASVLTNTAYLHHAALTGGVLKLLRFFPPHRFRRVSLPFAVRPQLAADVARNKLNGLLAELGAEPVRTRFGVFVPSRVDFLWKGHDRLMAAIDQFQQSDQFTFIFSGWGEDYPRLKHWAAGRANIRILHSALSKPLIYEFNAASDLVIDQFMLGHIGTSAREAASVGTPVMAWIKGGKSLPWARPEMPVLNAHSVQDIVGGLIRIVDGEIDLRKQGRIGQAWIETWASPQHMQQVLMEIINYHAKPLS
jgi:glycosyltransferase involved in cell wall biosynthesis